MNRANEIRQLLKEHSLEFVISYYYNDDSTKWIAESIIDIICGILTNRLSSADRDELEENIVQELEDYYLEEGDE